MKLTALLFFSVCVTVSARGLSQSVSYSGKDVSLETVFSAVEKQTGFVVMYDYRQISGANRISVSASNEPLSAFLSRCLKDQPFGFAIEDKSIMITKLSASAGPSDRLSASADASLPPPIEVKSAV